MAAGATIDNDAGGGGYGIGLVIMSGGDDKGEFLIIVSMGRGTCRDGNKGVIVILILCRILGGYISCLF